MTETTILCSGFGLGFYIPGLLIKSSLEKRGACVKMDVFEHYMEREKKEKIVVSRKAYQDNFAVAKMAARYPIEIEKSFDVERIDKLLDSWKEEKRSNFISLSGHWIYILEQYQKKVAPERISVELLYVDSGLAPSWKSLKKYRPEYNKFFRDRWLYDFEKKKINFIINVDAELVPYSNRDKKLVVHGGGWGIGTYKEVIGELSEEWNLAIVAYNEAGNEVFREGIEYYMNDPVWKAWEPNANGQYTFPPYKKLSDKTCAYQYTKGYHWLFEVTRWCKAIVSKPGAGTLIDSYSTATPLIMLDPFGEHEKKNTLIWKELGFGISYAEWKAQEFDIKVLDEMQRKIMNARNKYIDYSEFYYSNILVGGQNGKS